MEDEWHYAKERQKLIQLAEKIIKSGNPNNAMDLVDSVIVSVWDGYEEK